MKFPTGQRKTKTSSKTIDLKKSVNYANRGKSLEQRLETVNKGYDYLNLATIQFIPTPMTNKTIAPGRQIAVYTKKSTVDYIGTLQGGRAVAFDAKSTENKTSFPLKNIEQHQVNFLESYHKRGAAAFLIVEFTAHNKIFYLPYEELKVFWNKAQQPGAARGEKSIPLNRFFFEIRQGRGVALDYLAYIT